MAVRWWIVAGALGLIVGLDGCGSNSPTAPTPGCTQTVLFQGSGKVAANSLDSEAFSTSSTGRLDVFLDWTFATSQMAAYVVQGSCNLDQFNARSCTFLLKAEGQAKPKRVSVSNVAPGSYSLLIANFSAVDESASASVTLSSASCP